MSTAAAYDASSIQALSGLAHVRHRPLMYLGSAGMGVAGLHHLIWEIVDNSVDEAMGGHGDRIVVILHADGSVEVRDEGRGIPVDPFKLGPHAGRSALEVVLTETNAGGKFDGGSYKVSGGLHGVGASVVTGLSTRLDAEVWRGGRRHALSLRLVKGRSGALTPGVLADPLHDVGPTKTKGMTGTIIRFWPDLSLFSDEHGVAFTQSQWSTRLIGERFRHKSFVHPGLAFELRDERDRANPQVTVWCSQGGVADLVAELTSESDAVSPVLSFTGELDDTSIHSAMAWTVDGRDTSIGYANGVSTPEGGMHIAGFRTAITEAVQRFITDRGLLKDKEQVPTTRDIFGAAMTVVSIMIPGPQFAGNSKSKLMNTEASARARAIVLPIMSRWLEENPSDAKRVADLAVSAMRTRTKSNAEQQAARALLSKGSKSRNGLPPKLRDCTGKTARPKELLLVEGDSAGGTALDARDPSFQAILPLRGKPLNTYKETVDRVVKALADLILSMGCGIGDDFDLDKFRYDRIVCVADADNDGLHIRSLIEAFLYTWCPGFIESGRLFYALPPLWSTMLRGERLYLADDAALTQFRLEHPDHRAHVSRMKGLGEMDHQELRLVIGSGRTIGRVIVDDPAGLAKLTERLFGPKSEGRKAWFLERTGETLEHREEQLMAASKSKGTKQARVVATDDFEETIVDLPAVEQLDKDYFAYGQQVIEDRAVPSAADGLKPVHRRILWDMYIQRLFPDRPFVKTARVVGDTMALFHPHGDQSIGDALTRLAQPFANLVPLLDFHGNYGSPDFAAAAARYTETRLGFAGMLLLDDIDQRTVPMVENYEGSTEEPVILPAAFPNLLVNGANGIAVGLSSYLPPHDPREVCAATLHLIANPKATVDELMELLPGPSFPQECTITNGDEMTDIYRAGVGRVVVRGAWKVEELGRGRQQLVIISLPYADTTTGSTEKFIAAVGDAIDEGNLAGIVDYNDESSDGATRITIGLTTGVAAEQIIPALLRWTNLQVTNKVQMHFLDEHGSVRLYNLRSCIQAWVDHRVRVVIRRSEARLAKIEDRLHRLRGFLAVLLDIDRTIQIVRSSKTRAIARVALMAEFTIDEGQANAVLDLNLGQLTEDAIIEFEKEATELEKETAKLRRLLASPTALRRQVGTELEQVIPQFDGVALRVTTIATEAVQRVSKAAMVLDEPVTVMVDAAGYLQAQRASSKAKAKLEPLRSFDTTTAQQLVVVTATGQLHRALAASVPTDKPTAAVNVFAGLDPTDRVLGWWADHTFPTDLLLVTSDGQVKRIEGDDLAGGDRRGGISLVKLAPGAHVVHVLAFDADHPVAIVSQAGQAARFSPDDVRPMGRSASGVRGIKLAPGDSVVGAAHPADDDDQLLVVQAKGGAKRVPMGEFPVQGRGSKGVRCAVVTSRSGLVTAVFGTSDDSTVCVRDADGVVTVLSVGAFALSARDAPSGKIRGFDGVIESFETR